MSISSIKKTLRNVFQGKLKNIVSLADDSPVDNHLKPLKIGDKTTNIELSEDEVYYKGKELVSGDIDTLAGFAIHVVGTRTEGGLTVSSNVVDSYFYHKEAVGLAIGIEMKTSIDYIPERTSFLCNGMLKAGAVVRDVDGIVQVDYDNNQ